ncbi:MAG: 50S ribosomal protein L24 [Verrucomicrobia bacterium]|nr:50S ribosomal protein L24 [Verrucomicrobiota bacterium]
MKIRRNDTVLVSAGKDRGKTGKVLAVDPKKGRLTIEGVNFLKKHVRPNPAVRQTGIVERPGPMSLSNVRLVCTKCNKPTRVSHEILEVQTGDTMTKQKVRVCKQCHQQID